MEVSDEEWNALTERVVSLERAFEQLTILLREYQEFQTSQFQATASTIGDFVADVATSMTSISEVTSKHGKEIGRIIEVVDLPLDDDAWGRRN
jgi:hypothetical protein